MVRFILAGDIGGTNPRLAMVDETGHVHFSKIIRKDAHTIVEPINEFLHEAGDKGMTTDTCCIAIAGPVEDNKCLHPTHAAYRIDDNEIRNGTLLRNILVINDFEAIGHAVASLKVSSPVLYQLKADSDLPVAAPEGSRAIVGPGTGLGVSYLPKHAHEFLIIPSEGGHAPLPYLPDYGLLVEHVRHAIAADMLDAEELVSGAGIRTMCKFFIEHPHALEQIIGSHHHFHKQAEAIKHHHHNSTDDAIKQAFSHERNHKTDVTALIARSTDKSVAAKMALKVFSHYLGAVAQGVALHGMATGGVFIAGGIARQNIALLEEGDFMRGFTRHKREDYRELLKRTPVYIITDYDVSYLGCARAALLAFPSR